MGDYPILDFDPNPQAILQPDKVLAPIEIPSPCVLCFFQDVIDALQEGGQLRPLYRLGSEIGPNIVYGMAFNGRDLTVCHPGVGAPLAAGFLEELIALGCRTFIACGGCGVLDGDIGAGEVFVPATAVRDEGTSYHYLPPGENAAAALAAITAIEQTLTAHQIPYRVGQTWTTDAPYRETLVIVAQRRAEGCQVVEMEAAALFAVAQFRGVSLGQILYGGDSLAGEEWDHRGWHRLASTREKLFYLAAEAVLNLDGG